MISDDDRNKVIAYAVQLGKPAVTLAEKCVKTYFFSYVFHVKNRLIFFNNIFRLAVLESRDQLEKVCLQNVQNTLVKLGTCFDM